MHKSVFQFSKKMEEKKENMKRRYEDSVTIFERKKIIEKERDCGKHRGLCLSKVKDWMKCER